MIQANRYCERRYERRSGRKVIGLSAILASTGIAPAPLFAQTVQSLPPSDNPYDIVVTANRREETLGRVPAKLDVLTSETIDQRGIRSIEDISRFTPGLELSQTNGVSGDVSNSISIRGIASQVGGATTAIYIDDTPIQIRNVGYFGGNPYPRIFDLERVEVLKGPQGTLFGASAMGGAVRFITSSPSLTKYTGYARAEVSATEKGEPSYEAGASVSGPLVKDRIGFRLSAWTRYDGGFIDRVDMDTRELVDKDINSSRAYALRAAIGAQVTDQLLITPSVFYQHEVSNGRNQYWEQYSDIGDRDYRVGNPLEERFTDRFVLPALKVAFEGNDLDIYSNTSYFDRQSVIMLDYTNYFRSFSGDPYTQAVGTIPSGAHITTSQKNFTQELRLQSKPGSRFEWIIGAYYARQKQESDNVTDSNKEGGNAVNGPNFLNNVSATDEQIAAFVNIGYRITDKLKLTAGVRIEQLTSSFVAIQGGGFTATTSTGNTSSRPVTPRFGISYQADANNLFYANVAKGVRPGGAQGAVPSDFCSADLATLGMTSGPDSYSSDSVWSYDVGSKNSLFGGRVRIDANAYMIKWDNIQQSIRLANCGFSFTGNLGKATSKGIDIGIDTSIAEIVQLGVNVGYNDTTFDDDVYGGGGVLLAGKGDRIGGPKLTGTVWGQINFPLGPTDGYVRSDLTFRSKGITLNPQTFSYDADLYPSSSTSNWSMRAGTSFNGFNISVFVNNILNTNDFLYRSHDMTGIPLFYANGYRPRTFGATGTYRF